MTDGTTRPLRRRTETRRLLLAAAASLFDEHGSTGQGVEAICSRAGFTRGAFYSNFTSVDELYLALHQEQAATVWTRLSRALAAETDDDTAAPTLDDAVGRVLDALPPHREWFSLRAVLLARAAVDRDFAARMQIDDGGATVAALGEGLAALAARHGRSVAVEPPALAKAVVAAHIGAVGQAAVEQDGSRTERLTVTAVLRGLTVQTPVGR